MTTTSEQVKKLCQQACETKFKAVCVNPAFVKLAKSQLEGSGVLTCTVVGFPLGANTTESKIHETKDALARGADEIDMVINVGALKAGNIQLVTEEIRALQGIVRVHGKTLKVIVEMSELEFHEKLQILDICNRIQVDFVKTSTGFASGGATIEDISLMRSRLDPKIQIKASGGIRTLEKAKAMQAAGANRIGTSSGVRICKAL